MRNLLCAALTWISILVVVGSAAAQPDATRPTIHRVTVDTQSGVLTITGAGLGPHLVVTVEGASVPLLPGATDTQVDIAPPPELLTTPGTYRLTVRDPVRQIGDAFVVASQPERSALAQPLTAPLAPRQERTSPPRDRGRRPGRPDSHTARGGPAPMTMIEDSGSPYRTAIGFGALFSNTSSRTYNTASGYTALYSNTLGTDNTATGVGALFITLRASSNTASGAWMRSLQHHGLRQHGHRRGAL